jgi:two-component system, response regulator PdtaR
MTDQIKGTVLIVEDDVLLSLVEARIVVKLGYEVAEKAVSGENAIELAKAHNPDVILMDISLKGELDGIDTMKEIRKFSKVPVIFLSGNSDKISVERARKTGFIDYLIKPVGLEDLAGPMEKAMKVSQKDLLSHAS